MRIVFITREFPAISETPLLNQVTGFIDLGHQVDIISFKYGNTKTVHADVQKYRLINKTFYLRDQGSNNFKNIVRPLLFLFRTFFVLPFLMKKKRYDIIYCQSGGQGLRLLPFLRLHLLSGKLIVQLRGHDISEIIKLNGEKFYSALFRYADYFLPVCDYFRKRALALGCPDNKISTLRLGIDCNRFQFSERRKSIKEPIKILLIGRLIEKKGVEYAIRAISALRKNNYNVELSIVGDGILKGKLQRLCRKLRLGKYVNFLGEKNQTQIIEILNKSHLFVAPSVATKSGDQEGIPGVIKEAMACGLPVVSTYHSGIPELVKNGISGFLVPERDADTLADKLSYLIEHPKLWPKMGRAGRRFVEKNFNKETMIRELADLFQRVLASK